MSNYNIALLERLLKYEKDIQEMSSELNTLRGIVYKHPQETSLPAMDQKDSDALQLEMFDFGVLKVMSLSKLNAADQNNTIRFLKEKEFLEKAMDLFGGAQCPDDIQENALRTRYDSWVQHYRNLDYNIEYAAS
tara:strand:- start:280 stop:681 length:402 start_codon:yes stop_codon:yes gene_type:complete